MCPNVDKLHPHLEEDEIYLRSLGQSYFTNYNPETLYMLHYMGDMFQTMADAVQWLIDQLTELEMLPFALNVSNMMPRSEVKAWVRTADADLFGGEYKPGWGGDQHSTTNAPYLNTPDGVPDGYNWIAGANKLVISVAIILLLFFGGREIIEIFAATAGWIATTALAIKAKMTYKDMVEDINEIEEDVIQLLMDNDDISREMNMLGTSNINMNGAILEALKLLGTALDTNQNSDYRKFTAHISSLNIPEGDGVSDL